MAKWQLVMLGAMGTVLLGGLLAWLAGGSGVQAHPLASGAAVVTPTAIVLKADDGTYLCAPAQADGTRDCSIAAWPGKTVVAAWRARTPQDKKLDMQTRTTVFRLQERAQLEFKLLTNDAERIIHYAGRLFVSHDPEGRDKITVEAGQTRVDAIDTRFTVVNNGSTVLVAVPKDGGTVTVTLPNGTTVRVSSGQQITVGGRGGVQPISTVEQNYWNTVIADWRTIPGILPSAVRIPQRLPSPTPNPAPSVAPVQVSPNNQASVYAPGGTATVTFTWQPVNYPGVRYTLEIEGVAPITGLTGTSYTRTVSGSSRWRVWATGPGGAAGPKSPWRSFSLYSIN